MRVLIAGATGAIGRPLIRCLNDHHRTVFALARSPESARLVSELGAEPVIADALDAPSVKAAMAAVRPNAVINELTALPAHYTAAEMQAAAERDRKVRIGLRARGRGRRHPRGSRRKRRSRHLAPTRSIMRPGCAVPRATKPNASGTFSRARWSGW